MLGTLREEFYGVGVETGAYTFSWSPSVFDLYFLESVSQHSKVLSNVPSAKTQFLFKLTGVV